MFETIHALAAQAKIASLNINVRLNGEKLNVIVSFLLPSFDSSAVFDSEKSESQDFINLRAALSTPIVICAPASEIEGKVEQALRDLTMPVVEASTALAAVDLKALLGKATASAPKTPATPAKAKKSVKGSAAVEEAVTDEEEQDDETEQEEAAPVAPTPSAPVVQDFSAFDTL
jgi:hypothetical protein